VNTKNTSLSASLGYTAVVTDVLETRSRRGRYPLLELRPQFIHEGDCIPEVECVETDFLEVCMTCSYMGRVCVCIHVKVTHCIRQSVHNKSASEGYCGTVLNFFLMLTELYRYE